MKQKKPVTLTINFNLIMGILSACLFMHDIDQGEYAWAAVQWCCFWFWVWVDCQPTVKR